MRGLAFIVITAFLVTGLVPRAVLAQQPQVPQPYVVGNPLWPGLGK